MKNYNIITILILTTLFFSCRPKSIDIELEQLEQKPVIWSQVIPNGIEDIAIFYFSRSFSALNENQDSTSSSDFLNQILVENGSLTLTHENIEEDLVQLSPGIWTSLTTPLIVGDFYTLKGTDELLNKSIESTTQMMPTITMRDEFSVEIQETDSAQLITLHYQINDVPGDNWYLVNVYTSDITEIGNLQDTSNTATEVTTQIITDQTFNTLEIESEIIIFNPESDTVFISLSNISEQYYNYLALRERGGSIFNQLTGEPINYPTNIIDGYGYFNLVVPDIKVVILNE